MILADLTALVQMTPAEVDMVHEDKFLWLFNIVIV